MADSSLPPPRYSLTQAINVAITLGMRALDEVRTLARDGGKPGPAGLGFDDLTIEHDGERTFTFRMAREGMDPKVWRFVVPAQIYRGVYRDDVGGYQRGDVVTIRGSMYHCDADTQDKPGEGSKDWTLAVKNGKDGRDGKKGDPGVPGAPGRPGRDLTQLGPDGEKW